MKRVYVYCEGQTEETFINKILRPYFCRVDIAVIPIVCTTSYTPTKKYKGGVSSYGKIRRELAALCKNQYRSGGYVTTMFDYYAMPKDTPGIDCDEPDIQKRIEIIEEAINSDIQQQNFRFHFMLHEFEGILFSNPNSFCKIADESVVREIRAVKDEHLTPEHINNSPNTAPSKRLERLIPDYKKIANGISLAEDMGIDVIMKECPHFRQWIQMIKSW